MQHFDLLVFDWDGTLFDSAGLIAGCLQSACRDLDFAVPSDSEARYIIGLGMRDALCHVLPDLPSSEYPRLADRYRYYFLAQEDAVLLFDGVEALLEQLSDAGFQLTVATGKTRAGLDRTLQRTGIGHWFSASRCADECFSKPHPAMLQELMRQFGTAPERTLMIGDTTHDLQMAANAGCPAVAIATGTHPREQLAALKPLACLAAVTELGPWLTSRR